MDNDSAQPPSGWFAIPGVQDGPRLLSEQMLGLEQALDEVAGKTVLDLGCAEGLIAAEMVRARAAWVDACDNNEDFLNAAFRQKADHAQLGVHWANLNDGMPAWAAGGYDIVLALAIIHKLRQPGERLAEAAKLARSLLVIRLPIHAVNGVFSAKHRPDQICDTVAVMTRCGFDLERVEPGPRDEQVQYWRRVV